MKLRRLAEPSASCLPSHNCADYKPALSHAAVRKQAPEGPANPHGGRTGRKRPSRSQVGSSRPLSFPAQWQDKRT